MKRVGHGSFFLLPHGLRELCSAGLHSISKSFILFLKILSDLCSKWLFSCSETLLLLPIDNLLVPFLSKSF